jgi:hypothetical protein
VAEAPKDRVIYAVIRIPVRWHPYKPNSQEVKRGKMGRWQKMNEFGGWENLYPDKAPDDWEEDQLRPQEGSNLDVHSKY